MTPEDIEFMIIRTMLKANQQGHQWLINRYMQLGGNDRALRMDAGNFGDGPTSSYMTPLPPLPHYLNGVQTMGDAVVAAVDDIGRFSSSRTILRHIYAFPAIVQEPDARMRRRKVSQALYGQKGTTLVSIRLSTGTLWGRKAWVSGEGIPYDQFMPMGSDMFDGPDEEPGSSESDV